jgi:gluconokinase
VNGYGLETMSTFPMSPKEMTGGLMYFPRMLDKIRMHSRGKLGADYHENFGAQDGGDGMLCNFLRIEHSALCQRVGEGGSDEEILEWCYANGRRLNEGDIMVWNGFISKLGWNDFAAPFLEQIKQKEQIADRSDIQTFPDLIDHDEGRLR